MNPNKLEMCVQDSTTTKLPYNKPVVITFGSVAKLTLGGVGTGFDGCSGKDTGKSNGKCS